jgi:hypothetical protein
MPGSEWNGVDTTECPRCVAENAEVGGGDGRADRHFNYRGGLYGVCDVHQVYWYVTRELGGVPETRSFGEYELVEAVLHPGRPCS